MDRRKLNQWLVRIVFALAAALLPVASPVRAAQPDAAPVPATLSPVVAEYQSAFAEQLAILPHYEFELSLDPNRSTIGGMAAITFPNQTGMTLDALPFRLYPNAAYYGEGGTEITSIEVDGLGIAPRFDDSGTVLFVDLPTPILPGDTVTVDLAFETVIPRDASGSFGILSHDPATGGMVLADWYPVVAGWDETGWRLEPPTEQGDPTFSTTSLYEVHLTLPAGYEVFGSGDEEILEDGSVLIVSGPVREFAMVAAPRLETLTAEVGQTTVAVHAEPIHAENAQHVLDLATAALDFYDQHFGAYPFRELDLVETALSLAYGVSWSGILFINETQLALPPGDLATLDFTILHEIGHQWWGGTVGANSNDHTYMVEGLTNATAFLAAAAIQGAEAATGSLYAWIVTPYLNLLDGMGDGVADISIFEQPASAPLSTLAYGKGALGFLAIRDQIGDAAFQEGLAHYADAFRLGIAEPADLRVAFEAASGQSLTGLWSFWFDSADVTRSDVEGLVQRVIASLG